MDEIYELVEHLEEVREIREMRHLHEKQPRVYRERIDPFVVYDSSEFRRRYRLSKECVRYVVELVEEKLASKVEERATDITPSLQLLIALRYYAKGGYQVESGDLHGVSQQTVSRIVRAVSTVLATLLPRSIRFPEQVETLQSELYRLANFPEAVGCIDCSHVPIKNPGEKIANMYVNRKGFYSLNVRVVCNARMRILDIVAKWRGGVHDSRIWDECRLKQSFKEHRMKGVLLGDSRYPSRTYLLTPIRTPRNSAEER